MLGCLCPTCGCSLIRLGIRPEEAPSQDYRGETYYFCCEECREIFLKDPEKFLEEIRNVFVCLVCLGEKKYDEGVSVEYEGREIFFCRCPHCKREFLKKPDYYLRRLEGKEPYVGVFGGDFQCC